MGSGHKDPWKATLEIRDGGDSLETIFFFFYLSGR